MFYYFMLTAFATVAIYSFGELLDNVIQKREIQEKLLETILEDINYYMDFKRVLLDSFKIALVYFMN